MLPFELLAQVDPQSGAFQAGRVVGTLLFIIFIVAIVWMIFFKKRS